MIRYFSKKNKTISIVLSTLFILLPFIPVYSAELNSTNFSIQEYNLGSGREMNSTNYSITGDINQVHTGLFSVSNLPLVPGVISSCGKITQSGTYTLGANITGISGTCFIIEADDVIIDGLGAYSIISAPSNTNYAITATSTGSAASAHGTTTIQNITISGFSGLINASGNNATSGNVNGGNGGGVIIENSDISELAILTSAGLGSGTGVIGNGGSVTLTNVLPGNITNSGTGGSIYMVGNDFDLANKTFTTSGTFSIGYTGTLVTTNTTISAVSNFIVNGTNYGSYIGGAFPIIPGVITTCGTLYFSGTYTFGSNITGNCTVAKTGVTIDGNGNTLTGNISASTFGVTLSNINVTGTVSTTGAGAGALVVNNASNLTGTVSVTGQISGDGSSSLGNTTIAAGGSVASSSVSFVSDVINNGIIGSGISVVGKITNNGTINTGGGTFTFNASSTNSGTVNGNAILSASSTNSGTITGNATFAAYTAVSGRVNFSGTTAFSGTGYINGTVYDLTGINEINTWVFNGSSMNSGILKGNAIFNDSSKNATSSTVIGNVEFRGTSLNQGTVTGNSDVYSPVVRPLGGTTNGQVVYHDYAGLYFNDTAVGHGVVGKWDDINNWWLDSGATIHSPILPTSGDNVIIFAGTISTTTAPASVYSAVFQGTSVNGITLTVNSAARDAALFNASSTNNGTIIGNATFAGTGSVNNGTVTGYITRQYSTGVFDIVEDFTQNGVHWIIQAVNGATVNLTNATYSLITNLFEALGNSVFIFNNLIGGSVPSLTITAPVAGTNIKWKPIISWGTSTLCQYKIDTGTYTSVNCSLNGSDIPKPTAGAHTLFIKSTDAQGNAIEKTISFTYDNTQPIDTDCSTPLDEPTRPYYYLTSNVGTCSVTATTTLRGDDNGGGNFYTVSSITGNSKGITLQNINVTGAVSGFNTINVASSTLNTISINGVLTTDTLSTFGDTTIGAAGVVTGGRFFGNVTNNGVITNSTSTPVTVAGNTINNGTINNSFIFNASSTNSGTVNGTLTLNGSSYNQGTVNGDLLFNTITTVSNIATISGETVFRGTGTVTGRILDNRNENILIWLFEDSSTNLGFTRGTAYFNDSSSNIGTISGDAHFNDYSTNLGTVTSDAYRYRAWLTSSQLGGTVNGDITYYSYTNSPSFRNISGDNNWNNTSNWFMFAATTTPLGRMPVTGEDIVLFATTTLKSNLTNNIYIGTNGLLINGGNFTLTGNIFGNGAYGGHDAYDFNLERIRVTGTTTSTGGDGTPSIDGGDGGNINIQYSSTYVVSVNGGDPLHNGGDAGTIYVYNTIATQENTPILAVGGDSVGCGFGGSGGNVTLVDTSGYILNIEPGRSATTTIAQGGGCENPPSGTPPGRGQTVVSGTYNPSLNNFGDNLDNPNNNSDTQTQVSSRIKETSDWFLPGVDFNLHLSPFSITPLPMFGTGGENSFSFISRIKNFFDTLIPQDIRAKFDSAPSLLSSLGLNTMNDLITLKKKGRLLENTKLTGLFTIYSNTQDVPLASYLRFNIEELLVQIVHAKPNQELIITLLPVINNTSYEANFNGEKIIFTNNKIKLKMPSKAGTYTLSSAVTPIMLKIEVSENGTSQDYSMKERTVNLITIVVESTSKIIHIIFEGSMNLFLQIIHAISKIFAVILQIFS